MKVFRIVSTFQHRLLGNMWYAYTNDIQICIMYICILCFVMHRIQLRSENATKNLQYINCKFRLNASIYNAKIHITFSSRVSFLSLFSLVASLFTSHLLDSLFFFFFVHTPVVVFHSKGDDERTMYGVRDCVGSSFCTYVVLRHKTIWK